jgi:hypothetical protein
MSQMILEYDEFFMFYFHLFNVLLKKVKNVDIFHEIDKYLKLFTSLLSCTNSIPIQIDHN